MPTKVIKLKYKDDDQRQLEFPARSLAKDGLIIFPTETVYGIGVNADNPSAVDRLIKLKKSPADRPLTVHLSSQDNIHQYVNRIPKLAHRLIRYFWPGPLTLVLRRPDKSWVGLRLPDDLIARDLIRLAQVSVVASSANLAGSPPAFRSKEIIDVFKDRVDYIIDAGPTKYQQESTVVQIDEDSRYQVLRSGVIDPAEIKKLNYQLIVFICTGNTCRSPMAVGLFKKMLAGKLKVTESQLAGQGYEVNSAGTAAISDAPATTHAIEVAQQFGADISDHRSQPVTVTMLEEADQVYVMAKDHLATLREWVPHLTDKIRLLDPEGEDVVDPIGGTTSTYHQSGLRIKIGLEHLLEKLELKS